MARPSLSDERLYTTGCRISFDELESALHDEVLSDGDVTYSDVLHAWNALPMPIVVQPKSSPSTITDHNAVLSESDDR